MLLEFLLQNAVFVAVVTLLGGVAAYMWTAGGDKNMLDPEVAIAAMNFEKAQVLDLRTRDEFEQGHIPGARHTDPAKVAVVAKKNTVLLVCARGPAATAAARQLRTDGNAASVLVLKGGMAAWKQDGKPTTTK